MADSRGFVLLWRKFWNSRILVEPGRDFSRREAWLYLFSNLANGISRNGMERGQFSASVRFLAKAWGWPENKVDRFLHTLEREQMIEVINRGSKKQARIFKISKFGAYQDKVAGRGTDRGTDRGTGVDTEVIEDTATSSPSVDSDRDTDRDTDRDKSKERESKDKRKGNIVGPKRPNPATGFPPDFELTPEMRSWAKTHAPLIDIDFETPNFKDRHVAKGSTFRDWTAAWRTWIRNAQNWTAQRQAQPKPHYQETIDEQLERIRRKNDPKSGGCVR